MNKNECSVRNYAYPDGGFGRIADGLSPLFRGIASIARSSRSKIMAAGLSLMALSSLAMTGCDDDSRQEVCKNESGEPDLGEQDSGGDDDTTPEIKCEDTIPESTSAILRHAVMCQRTYADIRMWCENLFELSSLAGYGDNYEQYCESADPEFPERAADCRERLAKCDPAYNNFVACTNQLADFPNCEGLRPFDANHSGDDSNGDLDGDGLSNHAELWQYFTNPCEQCSFGDPNVCENVVCDPDADHDGDGIPNKDDLVPDCDSYVTTDGCG